MFKLFPKDTEGALIESTRKLSEVIDQRDAMQAELAELRAFKAACEGQGAVAELDDGFFHCHECGVVATKYHGRGDGNWCSHEAKWVQGPFYLHPDPEAAQLRQQVAKLTS